MHNSESGGTPAAYSEIGARAQTLAEKHHGCSQAALATLMEQMNIEDERLLASSSALVGGSTQCLTCGPLLAGYMVFGIKYGRRRITDPPERLEKSLDLARQLTEKFIAEYGTTNCCELTGFDHRDEKGREAFFASKEAGDACARRIRKTTEWIAMILDESA